MVYQTEGLASRLCPACRETEFFTALNSPGSVAVYQEATGTSKTAVFDGLLAKQKGSMCKAGRRAVINEWLINLHVSFGILALGSGRCLPARASAPPALDVDER
jgi:hypothetical protein